MHYISFYQSPMGEILLAADEEGLTGLWFCGQKYYAAGLASVHEEKETTVLSDTRHWLDIYFSGKDPEFMPNLHMIGTPFQQVVWQRLQQIARGQTLTYGEIARFVAVEKGLAHMSAQAVGSAVGHNKISIIIPCHRVVGADGSLTGYAGGIEKKLQLLALEGADVDGLFIPTRKTASR
ncbi:MAG: methylated-DNA--[protein]-cysteine S-methyltransferase [Peptococcaceae bacterium]|nr:methylated-DNA--[protein]-cysteine S-methyltransferase [Peptococcaceae bacterium]